jgi:hypothetical protein
MGDYRVLMPFVKDGQKYVHGDTITLPDTEATEMRDVGMLLHYGVIGTPGQSEYHRPDEDADTTQK